MDKVVPRQALEHTLIYLVFGVVWILGSDGLLFWLVDDPEQLTWLQTGKGWFFVLVTAGLLYSMIGRSLRKIELLQQHVQRTQKLDAMGKMAGGIAHDFANILGVVGSYSDHLASKVSGEQEKKFVQEISRSVGRGNELIGKLRKLSLVDHHDLARKDVNELIKDAETLLKQAVSPALSLEMELDSEPCPVLLNPTEFEHALLNLSINARQATQGSGSLVIRSRTVNTGGGSGEMPLLKPGRYVVTSVIDDGQGMDEAVQEHMFDPFFTTKGEDGTGLGLFQVYQCVKNRNGDVKVDSRPGHGSTISLYLPLAA